MSQVRLIIFIAAFITLTGNSKLLEKTLLVYPLSENWLFVCSLLIWLFVFLSALLLIFCYRHTIKPILIILLMISSIVSYAANNFGIVFDHNMIANTFETNTTEFLDQANFKSFLYLLLLGLLPSYFVIKTEIIELPLKSQLLQRAKAFVIMILIFILLIFGFSKLVDFPLRQDHPIRIHLINIAKVAIPLKNLILMRNVDDKIALLKSSGSCVFCDLNQGDFKGNDLKGVDLRYAILSKADLRYTNLNGADLYGVDLSNKDLTGTILTFANLSGTNLNGVDLSNKDLTGVNLSGIDLSNKDLTGTILKDAKKIEISLKNPSNSNWPALNEIQNLNVTRYDLSGDVQYLATKEGFLFESKNNKSRLVLDLNNDAQFPFIDSSSEAGLLGIASQDKLVYVSYTSQDTNGLSLVVDEYSMNFSKVRNIIKIGGFQLNHYSGTLLFDNLGKLYLSVGDAGYDFFQNQAQDLNSLKGKILRLDVSKLKLEPEIIAYGIRNPWGVTIDSKDRMFILQCGQNSVEAVYLLNDLYSGIPANLGWPVFEGSVRMRKDSLIRNDVLAPIFETNNRPGCLTGGVYLNDIESFLFADFYGTIRLLKQKENGDWYLLHEYKQEKYTIWGIGLDKKTKKIFVAPNNLELEILVDQVKLSQ